MRCVLCSIISYAGLPVGRSLCCTRTVALYGCIVQYSSTVSLHSQVQSPLRWNLLYAVILRPVLYLALAHPASSFHGIGELGMVFLASHLYCTVPTELFILYPVVDTISCMDTTVRGRVEYISHTYSDAASRPSGWVRFAVSRCVLPRRPHGWSGLLGEATV